MKKVLVIGCKGMAGHVVKMYLKGLNKYEVWGVARNISGEDDVVSLDVSNTAGLEELFKEKSFDIIVNCVGLLNKTAEENPDLAVWINSYFPHFLAKLSKKYSCKLIHISTDCVFSGKEGGYTEDSFKNGIGFYAQSKALGEVINSRDLTLRTSIIGPELKSDGIGLFHWFMSETGEVSGYTNAYWSGVTTVELAKAIDSAIDQEIIGLYQLTNNEKINKYDLISKFNQTFRGNSLKINPKSDYSVDKSLINTRKDFKYEVPSYTKMIENMKRWMSKHKVIYNYYKVV